MAVLLAGPPALAASVRQPKRLRAWSLSDPNPIGCITAILHSSHCLPPQQRGKLAGAYRGSRSMLSELTTSCGHVITNRERTHLAKAWITLQATPQNAPEYSSLFWAYRQSYNLAREEPKEAWQLILAIWSLDQSAPTKRSLTAGLIEELLCYHGKSMIEHIERQARADRSFATLLGAVRQNTMADNE